MKIETKFYIGQTIYKMTSNGCMHGDIQAIRLSKNKDNEIETQYEIYFPNTGKTELTSSNFLYSSRKEADQEYIRRFFGWLFKEGALEEAFV